MELCFVNLFVINTFFKFSHALINDVFMKLLLFNGNFFFFCEAYLMEMENTNLFFF